MASVNPTVHELLARASQRAPFSTTDAKSGSRLERITVDGEPYIVKHVHVDDDWTMRCWGDVGPRPYLVVAHGLVDLLPERIDHATVAAARSGRNDWGATLVLRDVEPWLVPPGDDPLPEDTHLGFLDDCAALCARTWGWRDKIGLLPYGSRWLCFGPAMLEVERALGYPEAVPRIAAEGWERFADRAPGPARDLISDLRREPWPMVAALRRTPSCFLHGDWKLGNLGTSPDGRTVLLDWSYPGEGPPAHDLAWYLALNQARLPVGHTKEMAIEAFCAALLRHGLDLSGWWTVQLDLCLLGALVQFGWEKALGTDAELAWWCDRASAAARHL